MSQSYKTWSCVLCVLHLCCHNAVSVAAHSTCDTQRHTHNSAQTYRLTSPDLQVMVVDLDQTLVHTAESEEERLQLQTGQHPQNLQSNLLDLSPHDHTHGKELASLLCIPRASLVEFFRASGSDTQFST